LAETSTESAESGTVTRRTARTYAVPCWRSNGERGYYEKPRRCTFGTGPYGYQQVDFTRIRWRSWGGRSAYGRGIEVANMGSRVRVRFKVYRARRCVHDVRVYTRLRLHGRVMPVGGCP
jgi:hypothetical protein